MAVTQYIGARYVPKFYENSDGTAEWQSGVIYEPLTIVSYNGNSYTSKKLVPASAGDPSSSTEYWVATGQFNEQINALTNRLNALENNIIKKYIVTPEMFGAEGDGIADDTAAMQTAVNEGALVVLTNAYKIHNVSVNSETVIMGGVIIPDTWEGTNLYKTAFSCHAPVVFDGVTFRAGVYAGDIDNRRAPLIYSELNDSFVFTNSRIENAGFRYMNTDVHMCNYVPTWFKCIDVKNVIIRDSVFVGGGGDELMVITPQTLLKADEPTITFENNTFLDNVRGGSINLFASYVRISGNNFRNFIYPGSIFNVAAFELNADFNTFENCNTGNVFDGSEGNKFYVETSVYSHNTYKGTTKNFIIMNGGSSRVDFNTVETGSFFQQEYTVEDSSNLMPAMFNIAQSPSNSDVIIADNNVKIVSTAGGPVFRCGEVGVETAGLLDRSAYPRQGRCTIKNNRVSAEEHMIANSKYMCIVTSLFKECEFSNNIIENPATDSLAGSAKYLMQIDGRGFLPSYVVNIARVDGNSVSDLDASFVNGVMALNFLTNAAGVQKGAKDLEVYWNRAPGQNVSLGTPTELYDNIYTDLT